MKAVIKTPFNYTIEQNFSTFEIDENDILIFRDDEGMIVSIVKGWDNVRFFPDDPITIPDDRYDAMEKERGYCDC